MAIATVEDVKRVLKRPGENIDAEITPFLEAAEEYVQKVTGRTFGATGTVTERFYNVRQGDILPLQDLAPTNVSVTVFPTASDPTGKTLAADTHYQVLRNGRLQLLFAPVAPVIGLEGVAAKVLPTTFDRVEVSYTPSPNVPAPVREATALLAAYMYQSSATATSGLEQEWLGDYRYFIREPAKVVLQVRSLLGPYRNKMPRTT